MTNLLENLTIDTKKYKELLLSGKLYDFEECLHEFVMTQIYDKLAKELIDSVLSSPDFSARIGVLASRQRMGKCQKREVSLQLRTGTYIKIETLYARNVPNGFEGSRYLSFRYWGVISHASPSYYSQISKFSVLCGSFSIVKDVLDGLQVGCNTERIRSLSLSVAKKCLQKRVVSMLSKEDDLKDKRVVISTDGGRIRTREYGLAQNEKGTHFKFATPWREPKLFVISIIDENGKIDRKALPIYDATFTEESLFSLLGQYLKALNISQVKEVQFIADGALWIWNNAKKFLMDLGVSAEKIVETLDYFHAVEHLKRVTDLLPNHKKDIKSGMPPDSLFQELKTLLWEGNVKTIIEKIEGQLKRISKKIKTELSYFQKNIQRMDYPKFRENKWLSGSGIIESGVRRMINLRFKSPSCFWKIENLDGLIFLRCALLSGRWNCILDTITNF
jgi:hypothetical protein